MPKLSTSGHGWPVGETRRGREAQGEGQRFDDDLMSSSAGPNVRPWMAGLGLEELLGIAREGSDERENAAHAFCA